jgi:hypothetical protein
MIEYAKESFMEAKEELEPMFVDHYNEIALSKDKIELGPDWDMYQALEDANLLHFYTMRENGFLAGYFAMIAMRDLHYKDHIFALNDLIYINPKSRKGFNAWRLIKFAERDLKDVGVSVMHINVKTHKPFDRLLVRLGFEHSENIFRKYIGG